MHKDGLKLAFQVMYNIHPKRQVLNSRHRVRLTHAFVYVGSQEKCGKVDEDGSGILDEVASTPRYLRTCKALESV